METTILTAVSDYELERGKPMPSKNHARIQKKLLLWLETNTSGRFEVLPEVNVPLLMGNYFVPDLALFPPTLTFDMEEDEVKISAVPLNVIEILSPEQSVQDVVLKARSYFDLGIKSYWLVIPPLRAVHVYDAPHANRAFVAPDSLRDEALGIELPLDAIFG